MTRTAHQGFTLIELSIVLVVIGLIVGGILVGQDLIRAAGERVQIMQIEKFNTAANTFFEKYGYLPGDIPVGPAAQFGFSPRGSIAGEGDGNGVIQGAFAAGTGEDYGETVTFWQDLTWANGLNIKLIEGSFPLLTSTSEYDSIGTQTGTAIAQMLPTAKIGGGNYIYVWNGTSTSGDPNNKPGNYFGLSAVTTIYGSVIVNSCQFCMASSPGLTVKQAYDIDSKIDDGLPASGSVKAVYVDVNSNYGVNGYGNSYNGYGNAPNAASPSATTCYDTTSGNYSITENGGAGVNCALSFRMQAGD